MSSNGLRDAAGAIGRLHGQDALDDAIIEALPDAAFGPFHPIGYKRQPCAPFLLQQSN
jgi:hypothetical protein